MTDQPHFTNSIASQSFIRDKLGDAWSRMLDCVVHDTNSFLVLARLKQEIVSRTLSPLLKGYHLALEHHLMEPEIKEKYLASLEKGLALEVQEQITQAIEFLELLHPYQRQLLPSSGEIIELSAKQCITAELNNDYYKDKNLSAISFDDRGDFIFRCAPIFIETLLAHLFRNAVLSIEQAGRGLLNIWFDEENGFYRLHVKDTGLGMSDEVRARVFERFFTKREEQVIPGLGFCRLAILEVGGDVHCHSVKGEYVHFIVMFPQD